MYKNPMLISRQSLLVFVLVLISVFVVEGQNCDRSFIAKLNYTNAELDIDYTDFITNITYRIFQRTNETGINNSCESFDIKKPIIIVEGFDILNQEDTRDIYNRYLNPHGLGNQLRAEGYDVIVLNWKLPQVAMQLNAQILEQFINHINMVKSTTEQLVITGVSMGGVLARYALANMENKGESHQTKLFISFDSPQQGAHIPLGVQAFLFNISFTGLAIPEIRNLYNTYISKGTQQLLQNNFFQTTNGETAPNPIHSSFFSELKALGSCNGYPAETKNIAISNGSLNGIPRTCFSSDCPGGTALSLVFRIPVVPFIRTIGTAPGNNSVIATNGKSCFLYKEKPFDLNEDWFLNVGTPPYDNLPGGYFPWFKLIEDQFRDAGGEVFWSAYESSSFIPTTSALDISTNDATINLASYGKQTILNNSPFDDIWWDTSHENQTHNEMTSNLSDWIHDQITLVENDNELRSGFYNKNVNNRAINNDSELHKAVNDVTVSTNVKVINQGKLGVLAGNSIKIKSGFKIVRGSIFSAKITNINQADCQLLNNLPQRSNRSLVKDITKKSTSTNLYTKVLEVDNVSIHIVHFDKINIEELDENDTTFLKDLNVYPNPFQNNINIDTNLVPSQGIIFDSSGRIIETIHITNPKINRFKFDLTKLKTGVYYLLIKGEKGNKGVKVIRN